MQLKINNETDLKTILGTQYIKQIKNFFGDEKKALKFLSSVMSDVQKTPKLLECDPQSLISSYMTMAQLELMPSGVSGEAYVLPYGNKAQFQLGYQGLITLFYRAGGIGIRAELVRKKDSFDYINGAINHSIDIFKTNAERGEIVGAYAIANVNGQEIVKAMNINDIIAFGKNFSKSFTSSHSPWDTKNDPEGWMYKKTVLKQLAKMLPKNESINKALDADNQDSRISDIKKQVESNNLSMGNFLKINTNEKDNKNKDVKDTAGSDEDSVIIE